MRWKKRARIAFVWRIISRTPSTKRGGSSAIWPARSISMKPKRYGSESMSRRLFAGWDSDLPNCAARPRRRGKRLRAMKIRSSARKKSGPSWNNRSTWNHCAGRSARLARPATLMRVLPKPAVNCTRAEKKAKIALAQLPGWSRSAEDLEHLAIPLSATLDQFESQLQEMTWQQRSLAERMGAEDDSIRQLESRLQSLELEQDVPTEEIMSGGTSAPRPRLATRQEQLA